MKRIAFFIGITAALLTGCSNCLVGQVPTTYLYVDETCGAAMPDLRPMLEWRDNCGIDTVEQTPTPGSWLTEQYNTVHFRAFDRFRNFTDVLGSVELLDTIPPELVGVDSTMLVKAYEYIDTLYDTAERMLARQVWYEDGLAPDSLWTDDDFCNDVLLTWTDPCKAFTGEGYRIWTFANPGDTVIVGTR